MFSAQRPILEGLSRLSSAALEKEGREGRPQRFRSRSTTLRTQPSTLNFCSTLQWGGACTLPALMLLMLAGGLAFSVHAGEMPAPNTAATMPPLASVRLLDGSFADAVKVNREYLLALEPNRLLAPYAREAGLELKAKPYGNWESMGLDGHTAGHYLSALATMIASGADTPQGELRRRLDYMISEMDRCQKKSNDGYLGGVPGSRELWKAVAAGRGEAVNRKWVPWYNLHKTFAGLRDAYWFAGNQQSREILVRFGDWCVTVTSGLSDEQMQRMLGQEHGGMNEVMADIYAITGDERYLRLARRFCHKAVLEPLVRHEDQLTGKHANTQIPKVIGFERIAILTGDKDADSGARFFWENVTGKRSVAFGGNSVSEHFNDPKDFGRMLESREGPETCNTYNMLRLTGQLFISQPKAAYADYYERALYNHLLASIHPSKPGYAYFTPIRPEHYRVYSQPDKCFWCCVGTGMENPGRYGEFIYAHAREGVYVNLFIASELSATNLGLTLRQETAFPDEPRTRLTLKLRKPAEFALYLRHPGWVATGEFAVRVNGKSVAVASAPSSYAEFRREWRDGDRVEIEIPMRTTIERLPDGSEWAAILRGPIVLASPTGTNDLAGLFANDSRMGHVASGQLVPLDRVPVLLASPSNLPQHVKSDTFGEPLRFRLTDVVEPSVPGGLQLIPFFRLHGQRYQMYWQLTTKEQLAARRERIAAEERAKAWREANTLDWVAVGEQQPEVEHNFAGEKTESGLHNGRRWRHGEWFQYTLSTRGEEAVNLVVTYWGGDAGRTFDILVNNELLVTETLNESKPGQFFEKQYSIPSKIFSGAANSRINIRFSAKPGSRAGGVYDVRLMKRSAGPNAAYPGTTSRSVGWAPLSHAMELQ
ncbi:MAG TPA: glycoside hydrolase family 127 protein [Clostridia bacterium]|nr:glycoside hydrolase family 127 protein [Clostridia bacterium]